MLHKSRIAEHCNCLEVSFKTSLKTEQSILCCVVMSGAVNSPPNLPMPSSDFRKLRRLNMHQPGIASPTPINPLPGLRAMSSNPKVLLPLPANNTRGLRKFQLGSIATAGLPLPPSEESCGLHKPPINEILTLDAGILHSSDSDFSSDEELSASSDFVSESDMFTDMDDSSSDSQAGSETDTETNNETDTDTSSTLDRKRNIPPRKVGRPCFSDSRRNTRRRARYLEKKKEDKYEKDWRAAVAEGNDAQADQLQQQLLATKRGRILFPSHAKTAAELEATKQLSANVRELNRNMGSRSKHRKDFAARVTKGLPSGFCAAVLGFKPSTLRTYKARSEQDTKRLERACAAERRPQRGSWS